MEYDTTSETQTLEKKDTVSFLIYLKKTQRFIKKNSPHH